jgi:hypothetical protein
MEGGEGTEADHLDLTADAVAAAGNLSLPPILHVSHSRRLAGSEPPYFSTVRPASSSRAIMKRRSESRFR